MNYSPTARDVYPISQLKSNASKLISHLAEQKRPVLITQNGHSVGVLLDPAIFDALLEELELHKSIARGLQDIKEGRTLTTDQLWQELGLT